MTRYFFYPNEHHINPLADQLGLLREHFPQLDEGFDEAAAEAPLHMRAEGHFLAPAWEVIGDRYDVAVRKVVNALEKVHGERKFKSLLHSVGVPGLGGHNWLTPRAELVSFRQELAAQQPGRNVRVVQAQFGRELIGKSTDEVRAELTGDKQEVALGVFDTLCMFLTHPHRFAHYLALGVNCAGDDWTPPYRDDRSVEISRSSDNAMALGVLPSRERTDTRGTISAFRVQLAA